jgi:Flp pilus assembly protein TadG
MKALRPFRELLHARRAAAALEFAIVAGVFMMTSLAAIELGFLWWTKDALQATAALTARCAALNACTCSSGSCTPAQFAVERASAWILSGIITADSVPVSSGSCNGASSSSSYTAVTITSSFWAEGILPPPFQSTTISVSACFPTTTFS